MQIEYNVTKVTKVNSIFSLPIRLDPLFTENSGLVIWNMSFLNHYFQEGIILTIFSGAFRYDSDYLNTTLASWSNKKVF
jgi:hypothetical protein